MDEGKLLALFRQALREEFGGSQAMVISLEEASRRLDVSTPTLRRMVRRGELLTVLVGKLPKVPVSEIRRIATPAMPEFGQRRPSRQLVARLKAASLGRKAAAKSLESELAELRAGRKQR